MDEVLKSGNLQFSAWTPTPSSGGSVGGISAGKTKWKKYWAIITKGALLVFKAKDQIDQKIPDTPPKFKIELKGTLIQKSTDAAPGILADRPNGIAIVLPSASQSPDIPSFLIDLETESESREWVRALRLGDAQKVFGVPLEVAAERSDSSKGVIPAPMKVCIEWLNKHALEEEGLYRVPGSYSDTWAYIRKFDLGENVQISDKEYPATVAAVVVQFMKLCPNSFFGPLTTEFAEVVKSDQDDEKKIIAFRELLLRLPRIHRINLRYLFTHLRALANRQEQMDSQNKMLPSHLAQCIYPTKKNLCEYAIINHEKIFGPNTEIFGVPLTVAVRRSDSKDLLPKPLQLSIEWLEKNAMSDVGLYRVPGSSRAVDAYVADFDDGKDIKIPDREISENVCSLIKRFLYSLPESIFTAALKPEFARIGGDKSLDSLKQQIAKASLKPWERIEVKAENKSEVKEDVKLLTDEEKVAGFKELIAQLPPAEKATVTLWFGHLHKVAKNSEVNKMGPKNLAVSIWPSLKETYEFLIEHFPEIF